MNYESPLYVNIVLYTLYALLLLAGGLTLWSVFRSLHLQAGDARSQNGVHHRCIALLTLALLVLSLLAGWLLGSTEPLTVNGKIYVDHFWLRVSDMLITTTVMLVVVACVSIVVGLIVNRQSSKRK